MIIVTGGAGMIGSNIVKALNALGQTNILVVDNLKDGLKFANLVNLDIVDYLDKEEFIKRIAYNKNIGSIKTIFHEGACSKTTEWDGKYMMENNYQYSKYLLNFCVNYKIPFLYASSAAIYGSRNENFIEERKYEKPLNVYGYSKMLFDHYVRQVLPGAVSPICGLRYFNIYGPGEDHKGSMASVIFHFNNRINKGKNIKLFEDSNNFSRDFTHVNDVVAINLWCWENSISGIYNCGTGHATSFQEIANMVLKYHKKNQIDYRLFPETLKGRYQRFTQANLTNLRVAGYNKPFKTVNESVNEYLTWLNSIK